MSEADIAAAAGAQSSSSGGGPLWVRAKIVKRSPRVESVGRFEGPSPTAANRREK